MLASDAGAARAVKWDAFRQARGVPVSSSSEPTDEGSDNTVTAVAAYCCLSKPCFKNPMIGGQAW